MREELRWAPLRNVADRIAIDQSYDLQQIARLEPRLQRVEADQGCANIALSSAAIIRAYSAAVARRQGQAAFSRELHLAQQDIDRSLACSPVQPFLWYLRFWAGTATGAEASRLLPSLALSYRLAPFEDWIARYRSEDALPYYEAADDALRRAMRAEFLYLIRDDTAQAGLILSRLPESVRDQVIAWLPDVPLEKRQELARALDAENVVVNIPGVDYREGQVFVPPARRTR